MNQILFNFNNDKNYNLEYKKNFLNFNKKLYLYIFIILILLVLMISSVIIYNRYAIYKKSTDTYQILNTYNISTLYSNNDNYNAIELSNNISIIGLIEIPKINISYPILSESNEDILKISVCRFSRSFTK